MLQLYLPIKLHARIFQHLRTGYNGPLWAGFEKQGLCYVFNKDARRLLRAKQGSRDLTRAPESHNDIQIL